jgi:myo-inositol-1(or 4)-monophosphatase
MSAADDRDLAARAARLGGAAALARFGTALAVADKGSGADPVTLADREAEAAVVGLLRSERAGDGVLGEEGAATPGDGRRRWLVDGLDGTMNFVSGLPHWCVAVGLEEDGEAVAAAVFDPLRGELFAGARGAGFQGPDAPAGPPGRVVATFLHPRKQTPAEAGALAERLMAARISPRMAGSGTLDLAWLAAGRLDGWVQPSVDPWDWVPGRALVEAAGGACVIHDGWHIAARSLAFADELAGIVA